MTTVFIVEHSYEREECDEAKLIGVFSTLEQAQAVVDTYKKLPGFCEHQEGFYINEYLLDQPEWSEGFITV